MAELISVIVTTYNREDALDAVLRSLARQRRLRISRSLWPMTARARHGKADRCTGRPNSGAALSMSGTPIDGFRAAEIRNRAILAARGAYCIFLDGDCIVRPDFVATHRRLG